METKTAPETSHGIKLGDVFVESWGYDQNNVNAYEVVKVTPKMVGIREIGFEQVGEGYNTRLRPKLGSFRSNTSYSRHGKKNDDGVVMKRVLFSTWNGKNDPYLNMTSYSSAYLWDGERAYFDTIAAGYPGH